MVLRNLGFVQSLAIVVVATSACEAVDDPLAQEGFRSGVGVGMGVGIEAEGSLSTLAWPVNAGSTYAVYRSTRPNFTISDADAEELVSGLLVGELVDDFAIDHDDPLSSSDSHDVGVFYQVVEHTADGDERSLLRVGRVSLGLVPSHSTGSRYAKVPLCLSPTPSDATVLQLESADLVAGAHWWDPLVQSWYSSASYDETMDLRLGNVLSLRGVIDDTAQAFPTNVDGTHRFGDYFELTGWVPPAVPPVCGPWAGGLYEGTTAVTWPVVSAPTMAADIRSVIGNAVPGAVSVGYWDVVNQQLRWYPGVPASPPPTVVSTAVGNFRVEPCTAVYIDIDSGDGTPDGTRHEGIWWPLYCAP